MGYTIYFGIVKVIYLRGIKTKLRTKMGLQLKCGKTTFCYSPP